MVHSSPAKALWNQRHALASSLPRLRRLIRAINHPGDFAPFQWGQVTAFALEFKPDLIVELGRGYGNSTCCFLEAASRLRPHNGCKVVSLCLEDFWRTETLPRLEAICPREWFGAGEILTADILAYDFARLAAPAGRVLVLWDAHGFEVAECVLGKLLPTIARKPHAVIMHDMVDTRYDGIGSADYGAASLWRGDHATTNFFILGNICSSVGQAISALDFTNRNRLPLYPAAESLHVELKPDAAKVAELRNLLGDFFSLSAYWFWFSANDAPGRLTFPRVRQAA